MLFGCSHVQRAPKKMNALLQKKLFIKGIITMMNKNFALIALVLGFSVVANVSAADKTILGSMKDKTVAGYVSVKNQCVAHPKTAIAITAASAAVVGLVVDAIVRREKCSVAQAYSYLLGKFGKKAKLAAELVVTEAAVVTEIAAD